MVLSDIFRSHYTGRGDGQCRRGLLSKAKLSSDSLRHDGCNRLRDFSGPQTMEHETNGRQRSPTLRLRRVGADDKPPQVQPQVGVNTGSMLDGVDVSRPCSTGREGVIEPVVLTAAFYLITFPKVSARQCCLFSRTCIGFYNICVKHLT